MGGLWWEGVGGGLPPAENNFKISRAFYLSSPETYLHMFIDKYSLLYRTHHYDPVMSLPMWDGVFSLKK